MQIFRAIEPRSFPNGATGWAPGGPFDCLGPYAKVENCPIKVDGEIIGTRTCYASNYADTMFSVPARTRWKGQYISGFFTSDENGPVFNPYDKYKDKLRVDRET